MKRVLVMVALAALVLGIAGTALAKPGTVSTMESGTIDPWGSTAR